MAIELLKPLQVFKAGEGRLSDGGCLFLVVKGAAASWLFRYTSPTGKRRDLALGACERSTIAIAADSLARARRDAGAARDLIRKGRDPLDERKATKQASAAEAQAKKAAAKVAALTLLRAARDYHAPEAAEVVTGRVISVADGDTLTVLDADKRQHRIRLAGIDAPERGRPSGFRSKETLGALVHEQPVRVEWEKRDRFGRIVGKVWAAPVDSRAGESLLAP